MFAQRFSSGEETQKFLMMTDSRNETSHTYNENVLERIYNDLHSYFPPYEKCNEKIEEK
jgi:hypothetical protein